MANLVEGNTWEQNIYQLETNDPCLGGENGIDNLQAKQLAARTQFLKGQQEAHAAAADPHPQYMTTAESDAAITAAVALLVNSSPAALDTLNELATAMANDPNFATTVTNALAGKLSLTGGDLTGLLSQNFSGKVWEGTPNGGAKVRNFADSVAANTGNIVIGTSYNCDLNPVTGVWAGRDVADLCWLEKWSDVGGVKEFWYAPTAAAGVVPAWTLVHKIDMVNGVPVPAGVVADVFSNTRIACNANGDTTVLSLNFTLAKAANIEIDWRSWFGAIGSTGNMSYGNARLVLDGVQKSRSSRIHLGMGQAGCVYTYPFNGSFYAGNLAAGVHTASLIWLNETPTVPAIFNPGPVDSVGWSQADSEIVVRSSGG